MVRSTMAKCLMHDKIVPTLVEQVVMNDDAMGSLAGWRYYRIEYGYECACPEGRLFLPPQVDSTKVEEFLRSLIPSGPHQSAER
jgi:hypothetical protein